ncbi:DUF6934 family protein [Pseudobacter ginsenosidimutans]|uniref:Uncharacterized protein n=1 Tax=Pseudobacter ginsenosidimutans TaxID=661488 RepID=A0A4Q7MHD3_9BACT|nr:hypothetical protein [Pseudobacter ginsenosidimutans]QEC45405.1 hypothetical protein FSB84_28315 [Pseudobacter ginsenosidimutans]RZS66933.1 hypothetical protein EV199_5317 [Pseudobacter ginsenosidimutans]
MHLEKYAFRADENNEVFAFESNGPNGIIRKVVRYIKVGFFNGFDIYNLDFGDNCDGASNPNHLSVSNNGDRDKVLATVAATVLAFNEDHKKFVVFAKGATPVRTRLYQMGINANLNEIEEHFHVYGINDGVSGPIQAGINYQAFIAVKK